MGCFAYAVITYVRGRVRLVLVGGAPGAGKSTVAQGLAAALGARVLRSDRVRKDLFSPDPLAHASAGIDDGPYRPSATDATDATYAELLARARSPLGFGQTVVLDATWRDPRWRMAAASLAAETSSDLVELRCVAPLEMAVDRVERRMVAGVDPSDATEDVVRALAASAVAWTTATDVDTAGDPAHAVAAALARTNRAS